MLGKSCPHVHMDRNCGRFSSAYFFMLLYEYTKCDPVKDRLSDGLTLHGKKSTKTAVSGVQSEFFKGVGEGA